MAETPGTCTLHAIFPTGLISLTQWSWPSVSTKLPSDIGNRPLGSPKLCGGLWTQLPVWPRCRLGDWPPVGIWMILQFPASGTTRSWDFSIMTPSGALTWLGLDPGVSTAP